MIGKLPPSILSKYILDRIGSRDSSVLIGPSIGEDSAVIKLDGKYLVIHSDPITGAAEYLGWLSVHIVSNDIAVTGARPRWLLPVYFFREDASIKDIDVVTKQVDEAAKEIGAMIVGGHSEYTPGLPRHIISMTALGIVDEDKYVSTGGAEVGDRVIMTKYIGLEGTAILASDFKDYLINKGFSKAVLERASKLIRKISVVKEALLLSEKGLATSMHDPTEGGLVGGLTEVAYASKKSIVIYEDRLNILDETIEFSKAFGIDYLKLLSSGVLIATVSPNDVEEALNTLSRNGIEAREIGYVEEYNGYLLRIHRSDGRIEEYKDLYFEDEVMKLWGSIK